MEAESLSQEEIEININIINKLIKILSDTIQNLNTLEKYESKVNLNNAYQRKFSISLMGNYHHTALKNKDTTNSDQIDPDLTNCIKNIKMLINSYAHDTYSNYIYWFSQTINESLQSLNRFINRLDAKYELLSSDQLRKISPIVENIEKNMLSIAEVTR